MHVAVVDLVEPAVTPGGLTAAVAGPVGTGGAVTWDSTATGEWEETELKAANLLSVASSSVVGSRR